MLHKFQCPSLFLRLYFPPIRTFPEEVWEAVAPSLKALEKQPVVLQGRHTSAELSFQIKEVAYALERYTAHHGPVKAVRP